MLENTDFTYDGIRSEDMKVIACKVDSGLFQESFLPSRSIVEESIRGRKKPYFLGFEYEPFEFPLTLYFDRLSNDEKRMISRWLLVDYYKPLIFEYSPDRIFYCMYNGDVDEFHNGLNQGYLELNMRCDSPFSYSPIYTSDIYDFSNNPSGGTLIEFTNYGDDYCKPSITLEKVDNDEDDIRIVNLSDGGNELNIKVRKSAKSKLIFKTVDSFGVPITNVVLYGDTVKIGNEIYEFTIDSTAGVGHIGVNLGTNRTASNVITKLVDAININTTENIIAISDIPNNSIIVKYNTSGTIGNGKVQLSSTTVNGKWTSTTLIDGWDEIMNGEVLKIDCENEQIDSEVSGVFHYENHNNKYLRFTPNSINRIKVYGKCKLQFKYRFTIYQG